VNLSRLLASRAASDPGKVAFAMRDERLTYSELWEEAGLLAGGLYDRGVRPGDRVALLLGAGLDFVRLFWAIQRLGATSVALNPFIPEETALRRAARVRPKLIVRDVQQIPRVAPPVTPPNSAEDFAFLQPTSGTSGESRAVMIRHRNIMAVLSASAEAMGICESDVLVSWVPPWHDLGLVRFIIGTVHAGATCHIVPPAIQTIPEWLATISEMRGTISGAPDFAIRLAARLVKPGKVDLSSLRYITNGGEAVRLTTIEAFEQRFHVPGVVLPGYGLAEATLGVTATRPGERPRTDSRGNVSCGTPLPDVEVRVAEDGELLVRGPGVFAGYFEAEEATHATLRDGWLYTGDVGHLDEQGNVYVLGRKRAMLKRGGAAIAPRELEEAAQEVAGVKVVAAIGIPTKSTEEIVIVVEAEVEAEPLAAAVSQAIRRMIGFAPQRVLVVKPRTILRTYNGKLRHDALRTALMEGALDASILYDSRTAGKLTRR
jgi:acyl-CoA synthetase (AMP-forming)/AMP-acid ligase II